MATKKDRKPTGGKAKSGTTTPKLFVSYSWTSPDHEAWVIRLATGLQESGVEVILDKWDLKEGHDAHAFMEQMVTDPEIEKVILVCDKAYADKADKRAGGVGTEAQIITPELYAKKAQDKFVAVVTERDEAGNAYVPAYFKSRIHIDFSDSARYSENFEQLLRWIFGQPLHKKPPLGKKPAFLSQEEGAVQLTTSSRHRRAMDAITNGRDHAVPALADYFSTLVAEFEKLRIDPSAEPFDDAVVENIDCFLPYRNEAIEILDALALYLDTDETRRALHRFFEQLIPYLDRPQHITTWKDWDFDNFKFIVHELFLYALAILIRHERFQSAAYLMATDYYVTGNSERGRDAMVPFEVFRDHMPSLAFRNQRLKLGRLSLRADMLKERCAGIGIEFRHLMQADFILFLRDRLDQSDVWGRWWPETLLYVGRYSGPFEVFARCRSTSYFERAKILLGIEKTNSLASLLSAFQEDPRSVPKWEFTTFSPTDLLGFNDMVTKP